MSELFYDLNSKIDKKFKFFQDSSRENLIWLKGTVMKSWSFEKRRCNCRKLFGYWFSECVVMHSLLDFLKLFIAHWVKINVVIIHCAKKIVKKRETKRKK